MTNSTRWPRTLGGVFTLIGVLSAIGAPTLAQSSVSQARRAARCLDDYAAARPTAGVSPRAELDQLSSCLGVSLERRLPRARARWLASCYRGAAGSGLAGAEFEARACGQLAVALSTWDNDRRVVVPREIAGQVRVRPLASPDRVGPTEVRQVEAFHPAGSELSRCRSQHGDGIAWVVADLNGSGQIRVWHASPQENEAWRSCVERALRTRVRASGARGSVAFAVYLGPLRGRGRF